MNTDIFDTWNDCSGRLGHDTINISHSLEVFSIHLGLNRCIQADTSNFDALEGCGE